MRTSLMLALLAPLAAAAELYVAPHGDDAYPGTKAKPFATLVKARDAIRALKAEGGLPEGGVRVNVASGRYALAEALALTQADSGTAEAPVSYVAPFGAEAVVSGGRRITGWRQGQANRWTVELPDVKAGRWHFRQLFADGRRLTRARTPNEGFLTTVGPLSKYADQAKRRWGGYRGVGGLRRSSPDAYCGFQFKPGDVEPWPRWQDAEILTYHSWECSWQTIRRIDAETHDLHLNTPCRYPIGFFSSQCRYRIENVPAALDAPGEWHLDREAGVLTYLAREGEDPRKMDIVAPVLETLLTLDGVEHVTFLGLAFEHARYPMGIYDVAPDWPAPALAVDPSWPKTFPPGYTDSQASPRCGQAIDLTASSHIAFEACDFAHLGAYALRIGKGSHHNRVVGCVFRDLGGGGVLVGMDVRDVTRAKIPREEAPSHNLVANCRFHRGSLVHPSAVAVWIAQSHHNTVARNLIADFGYSGISLGWTWGRGPNYSDHNLVEANHIHHVLQALADGGGIYTLGILDGGILRENYIHDIARPRGAIGSHNNGMFLDEGSQSLRIERNVIRRIGHAAVRHNRSAAADHTWADNDFDVHKPPSPASLALIEAAGPEHRYRKRLGLPE